MKHHLGITIVYLLATAFLFAWPVLAQTGTPSTTAGDQAQKIEELKERLATKVAELRDVQRRAISGIIKGTTLTSTTVETPTRDVKVELPDNVTVIEYLKGKRTKLTLEEVAKNDRVVVFGEYDTTIDLLKARVIHIVGVSAERLNGTVTAIDREEFTLTVTTPERRTVVVDTERTTRTMLWTAEKGLTKGGFSKITVGDTVHVVGTPVPKKEGRLSAIRILDLGNLTGPATPTPTLEPTVEATPSPTTKTSPTPKPSP